MNAAPKPRLLVLVVLRRVIEFALGQLVERDAHSLDPGQRLSKNFVLPGGLRGSRRPELQTGAAPLLPK